LAFLWTRNGGKLKIEDAKYTFQAMIIEAAGAFIYLTLFLIQTEPATRFSNDPAIRAFTIAAAYVACVTFTKKLAGGSINPAYGVCVCITGLMDTGSHDEIKWIWLYLSMPIIGGACSLIFHEFIYKKDSGLC
jgi:glycerol uptake facilitator-like aquaporin